MKVLLAPPRSHHKQLVTLPPPRGDYLISQQKDGGSQALMTLQEHYEGGPGRGVPISLSLYYFHPMFLAIHEEIVKQRLKTC